jgi:hypothetical protein
MADFIAPVIDRVLAVLEKYMPATLPVDREPVVEFGRQFTGVVANMPSLFVMPVRTAFDADAQYLHEAHQVQIKLAVSGSQPGAVTEAAMAYVRAVDLAIAAAEAAGEFADAVTGGQVLRVFVAGHDYGPLFEGHGGLARFPEIELIVEVAEQ